MSTWTPEELDRELERRRQFPPHTLYASPESFREEWTTVAALRSELDAMSPEDPDREWREWNSPWRKGRRYTRQTNSFTASWLLTRLELNDRVGCIPPIRVSPPEQPASRLGCAVRPWLQFSSPTRVDMT